MPWRPNARSAVFAISLFRSPVSILAYQVVLPAIIFLQLALYIEHLVADASDVLEFLVHHLLSLWSSISLLVQSLLYSGANSRQLHPLEGL